MKSDLLDELSRIRAIRGQQSRDVALTKPAGRREKLNLVLITVAPLILAVILFSFTYPETLGNATHLIRVR